jgi:ribosomal protein S18 acetylase RimI-like enzyme
VNRVRLGALHTNHRERVREILDATAVFRPEEVEVALELFDERLGTADGTRRSGEERARSSEYEFIGAFDAAGGLAGYACFGPTPSTDRTYDLYWIAVHPAAQGEGAGSTLLAAVERRLAEQGARLFVIETSSRSDYGLTRRFYLARGYTEAARARDFYASEDDRVIYTKRLDRGRNVFAAHSS